MLSRMTSLAMKIKAERRMRELLEEGGMRPPDLIQYGESTITVYWHGADSAVMVEIDDDGEIGLSSLAPPPHKRDLTGISEEPPPGELG
jgi:hypothetical protein